jgi:putative membrane protein
MMGYGGMGWGGMAWVGMIGMVLVWVILIAAVVWAVTRLLPGRTTRRAQGSGETPEEILDRRFAMGEIDIETYQTQRAALKQARGQR